MSADNALVADVRAEVLAALSGRERDLAAAGRPPLGTADEQALGRQLIAEALGVEVLARLPWDPEAAGALVSVPASARELRLSPLVRAARSLADRLAKEMAGVAPSVGSASGEVLAASRSWRAGALRTRVLRARRAEPAARSTNGSTPEEVSR